MKKVLFILIAFLLAACTGGVVDIQPPATALQDRNADSSAELEEAVAVPLPDLGHAPELENEIWLNTDVPLRLADLRGQVVLLDMWTFG